MTELINQLVEEMEEIAPKYRLIRILCKSTGSKIEKICSGNDIEELRKEMRQLVIKRYSLEEYVNEKMLEDCREILLAKTSNSLQLVYGDNQNYIQLFKKNGDSDKIEIDNFDDKNEVNLFYLEENSIKVVRECHIFDNYGIID